MSQSKKSKRSTASKFNPSQAAVRVKQIAQTLSVPGLNKSERNKLRVSSSHVSNALIESMANLASENGGSVMGLGFDVEEARAVLAYASECKAVVDGARAFAQHVQDDVLTRRAAIAERASTLYSALAKLVRTPEGNHLVHAFEQMHAQVTRGRHRRANTAKANATPAETPAGAKAATAPAPQAPVAITVTH